MAYRGCYGSGPFCVHLLILVCVRGESTLTANLTRLIPASFTLQELLDKQHNNSNIRVSLEMSTEDAPFI